MTHVPSELPELDEGDSYAFPITLENTGLITAEKEKQTITYSLNTTVFQEFLKGIAAAFHQGGDEHEN